MVELQTYGLALGFVHLNAVLQAGSQYAYGGPATG